MRKNWKQRRKSITVAYDRGFFDGANVNEFITGRTKFKGAYYLGFEHGKRFRLFLMGSECEPFK
jgi:hypothetical protein